MELYAVRLFQRHQGSDVRVVGLVNAPTPPKRGLITAPTENAVDGFHPRASAENQSHQSAGIQTQLRLFERARNQRQPEAIFENALLEAVVAQIVQVAIAHETLRFQCAGI